MIENKKIFAYLVDEYQRHSPKSAQMHQRAEKFMVDGGSHAIRLIDPFPPRILSAKGAYITDVDGHSILDFWQGHFANILGHNPPIVANGLAESFQNGFGLQTGFTDELQIEVAELLCSRTGCEKVRFTTSGTLATMYAVLLARAYTQRDLVVKVGGGWHGAQPWGLKGVSFHAGDKYGYDHTESKGLPPSSSDDVIVTTFNQTEKLKDIFLRYGDKIACLILEPFIGAGGLMWASKRFIQEARLLTEKYGAILIFDEVIAGFRFRAGDAGRLFEVQPDLSTFGKIIGGGMPVAAVGGKSRILELAGKKGNRSVKFSGGTYSAHPASMLAAKLMLETLVKNENTIYPYLEKFGTDIRSSVERVFANENILARCTGYPKDGLPGSSVNMIVFPYHENTIIDKPEDIYDPNICDVFLGNEILQLALLIENVHVVHGLGALSTAHTPQDIDKFTQACQGVAHKINLLRKRFSK